MRGESRPGRLPALIVPLAAYLAVTLGVPVLNGALRSAAFHEHALTTIVIAAMIVGAWAVVARLLSRAR